MTLTRRHKSAITVPSIPALTGKETEPESITRRALIAVAEAVRRLATDGDASYGSLPTPHGATHDADGSDPLTEPGDPTAILIGASADPGVGPAAAREDHIHPVLSTAPAHVALAGTAGAPAEGVSTLPARADHDHGAIKRETEVMAAGVSIGVRGKVNIVSGATVVDNAGADRVDVTVPASASSILTTKGDIIVRDGSGPVRKGVGANYTLLEADSAQTDGLHYTALTAVLLRLLTGPGFIANSGAAVAARIFDSSKAGNPFWMDPRHATLIGAGDSPNMPGWPWLGFWLRDSALTNNVAFEVFRVAMPTDSDLWSGHIEYTAVGSDGTDQHQEVGALRASAIRDAVSAIDAQVGGAYGVLPHIPVGTLAVTWSASVVGSDAIFSCKINSSLASNVRLRFRLQADNTQAVTFAQT